MDKGMLWCECGLFFIINVLVKLNKNPIPYNIFDENISIFQDTRKQNDGK